MNSDSTPPDAFETALKAVMQSLLAQSVTIRDPATITALTTTIQQGPESLIEEVLMPWEEILATAVAAAFPDAPPDGRARLTFLYTHATFIWQHLERLFQRFEGSVACADKTRWVLSCYQAQCLGQPLPTWPPETPAYWHPKTHSLTFWVDLIPQLALWYEGDADALDLYLVGLPPFPGYSNDPTTASNPNE